MSSLNFIHNIQEIIRLAENSLYINMHTHMGTIYVNVNVSFGTLPLLPLPPSTSVSTDRDRDS